MRERDAPSPGPARRSQRTSTAPRPSTSPSPPARTGEGRDTCLCHLSSAASPPGLVTVLRQEPGLLLESLVMAEPHDAIRPAVDASKPLEVLNKGGWTPRLRPRVEGPGGPRAPFHPPTPPSHAMPWRSRQPSAGALSPKAGGGGRDALAQGPPSPPELQEAAVEGGACARAAPHGVWEPPAHTGPPWDSVSPSVVWGIGSSDLGTLVPTAPVANPGNRGSVGRGLGIAGGALTLSPHRHSHPREVSSELGRPHLLPFPPCSATISQGPPRP